MNPRRRLVRAACIGAALLPCLSVLAAPKAEIFNSAQRGYWAFQPVERPVVPAGAEHPVDAFVREALAEKGLDPAPPADRVTLIRRAYFDLTGLPPSPEQVAAFVNDPSPDAFEKVIGELLASPHYGERWARHWLDVARYAESNGFKSDETRPNAWRYRDYVIQSFNEDKPYDRFVEEQIAGDELWPNDPMARVATAFNRHYPDESNAANLQQRRAELLQDVTDVVGQTFLGLTVGCAKCHDHKFDPILQKDYYRLQAFFAAAAEDDEIVLLPPDEHADYKRRRAQWEAATHEIRAEMQALIEEKRQEKWDHFVHKRTPEVKELLSRPVESLNPFERQMYHKHIWQMGYVSDKALARALKGDAKQRYQELEVELAKYDHLNPGELPMGMGIRDLSRAAPPTHVLNLANYAAKQEPVEPGFLTVLSNEPPRIEPIEELNSTGRRTALAKWLTDPSNPLTARVMVNRIWHYHFGQGIVATPSDFGLMGERPTHPELLDWLAAEFVRQGWSIKQMHRLIMTSETYQQSSAVREEARAKDPFNRLLWRFPPQRLEGEVIRDAMLAVSGKLNPTIGGPSVFPDLPRGAPEPRGGWETSEEEAEKNRRSIYIFVRRNARFPMLEALDMPDTHESCARRTVTTTAPQALSLLNGEDTIGWARGLAGRALEEAGGDDAATAVERAYLLAFARPPDGWEKDKALTFLETQARLIAERHENGEPLALPGLVPEAWSDAKAAALTDLCHALMNANEFVYRY